MCSSDLSYFTLCFLPGYTWNAGAYVQGTGIASTAALRLLVGLERNGGGTADWRVTHQNDAGAQTISTAIAAMVGIDHEVLLHWKCATAPGANNGVVQVWIDKVLITDLSNVDSDTLTANGMIVGSLDSSASVNMVVQIDDTAIGTYQVGWDGPDLPGNPWSVTGTSAANTAQTITKAALTGYHHVLKSYSVSARGGTPGAGIEIQVKSGDVVVWRDAINGNTPASARHRFRNGIKAALGAALSVTVSAGGTSVITEADVEGETTL